VFAAARWVLFADRKAFEAHASLLKELPGHRWIANLREVSADSVLHLIPVSLAGSDPGRRALASLEAASAAAVAGNLQAIVPAPVSKEAIGGAFVGQPEWLSERAGAHRFAMAFFTPTFKVVLATIHVSLRQALDRLTENLYMDLIPFVDSEFRRFGFPAPRIAVAGINPHAGENGMFGREDLDILKPAVDRC